MNPEYLRPIADHLWQSTLFAAVAALLTLALRKNPARVRHWLWLAASFKFLVPFAALIAFCGYVGRHIAAPTTAAITYSNLTVAMDEAVQPFTSSAISSPLVVVTPFAPSILPSVLLGLWLFGFIGITASWCIRWRRIRGVVLAASPLPLEVPIPAVSSATLLEPGVYGVFRPVLLLPAGLFERLTPEQWRAVVAHELCHVGHRDNLTAAVHMFVESVFWFHPLVWWIGKRMVEERERACDEEVVRIFGEPKAYAEGILNVCKLYVESPRKCVSGVSGSNLKTRIETILSKRGIHRLNFGKKLVLLGAVMSAIAIPIVLGVMNAPVIRAQSTPAAVPKFEVASIRPCKEEADSRPPVPGAFKTQDKGRGGPSPGRMIFCQTLENYIRLAYFSDPNGQTNPNQYGGAIPIEGGPDWIHTDRYQINAKAEGNPSGAMMRGPMMRALLEDRFHLRTRREARVVPAYELTVVKGGPKLPAFQEGSCVPGTFPLPELGPGQEYCIDAPTRKGRILTFTRRGMTLDNFSTWLYLATDRPVVNNTGINGRFDIHLEFTPDDTTPGMAPAFARLGRNGGDSAIASDPTAGTSIFTALKEQLGLELRGVKGTREFLVIEHIERPTEN
jgi:bla regulator protein BlaR1